jgi:hypothetical protein
VALISYLVADLATFLPGYVLTVVLLRPYGPHPAITAFMDGRTAAAIEALRGAVIVLVMRSLVGIPVRCSPR